MSVYMYGTAGFLQIFNHTLSKEKEATLYPLTCYSVTNIDFISIKIMVVEVCSQKIGGTWV